MLLADSFKQDIKSKTQGVIIKEQNKATTAVIIVMCMYLFKKTRL